MRIRESDSGGLCESRLVDFTKEVLSVVKKNLLFVDVSCWNPFAKDETKHIYRMHLMLRVGVITESRNWIDKNGT